MTERMLWNYVAPALLSPWGKAIVLVAFFVWSSFSAYAWTKIKVDFSRDTYLLDGDDMIFDYRAISKKYFGEKGLWIGLYTMRGVNDVDLLSEYA